jgi:hypothetical protein
MNRISRQLTIGTFGELLVQLRLLQFDVQAAPPLKDSGNDLIAIRGEEIRTVQVKTTTGRRFRLGALPRRYHVLALVALVGAGRILRLDKCRIFLLPRSDIKRRSYDLEALRQYELDSGVIDLLFPNPRCLTSRCRRQPRPGRA